MWLLKTLYQLYHMQHIWRDVASRNIFAHLRTSTETSYETEGWKNFFNSVILGPASNDWAAHKIAKA